MSDLRQLAFRVPSGDEGRTLEELLRRAWPEGSDDDRQRRVDAGAVEVDERIVRDLDYEVRPGATIEAELDLEAGAYGMPDTDALERGDTWVVVDKPRGMPGRLAPDDPMHPIYFLADRLGIDRDTFTPVWPMPTTAAGPWLFGRTPGDATQLRRRWREGSLMTTWVTLVPRPDVPEGDLHTPAGHHIQYSATTLEEGLAELQLTLSWEGDDPPEQCDPATVLRETLAEEGTPVVGDRLHGGFMPAGGLRLRLAALFDQTSDLQHSWQPPDDWWPATRLPPEEVERRPQPAKSIEEIDLPELTLKPAAIERLRDGGHPWIRPTEVAGRQDHFRPGTLVRTRGTNDVHGPIAIVDDRADAAARIWSDDPLDAVYFEETVGYRTDRAIARRAPFFRKADETDLFRLIHGEADQLPGLAVDRVGSILRATLHGDAPRAFRDEVYNGLQGSARTTMIVEVTPHSSLDRDPSVSARVAREGASYGSPERPLIVREQGLKYLSNPWSLVQDVDPSHRPTRIAARRLAGEGDRWLVATAPTTALAVPLAAAGCERIAHAAPEGTRDPGAMLELNGCDPKVLRSLDPNALRRLLERADETFDGVALDVGIGARLLNSDHTPRVDAVAAALECVEPGAALLLFSAPTPSGPSVEELVEGLAERTDRAFAHREELSPPGDFPVLEGFPEGTPYEGHILRLQ